jgi:hypothetical protein
MAFAQLLFFSLWSVHQHFAHLDLISSFFWHSIEIFPQVKGKLLKDPTSTQFKKSDQHL